MQNNNKDESERLFQNEDERERLFPWHNTTNQTPQPRPTTPDDNIPSKEVVVVMALVVLLGLAIWLFYSPRGMLFSLSLLAGAIGAVWLFRRAARRGAAVSGVVGILTALVAIVVVPGAWGEWSVLTGYQECERQVTALHVLKPLDNQGFQSERGQRQLLAGQYPGLLAPRLVEAEEEWLRRACAELTAKFEGLAVEDLAGFDLLREFRTYLHELLKPSRTDKEDALRAPSLPQAKLAALAEAEKTWAIRTTDHLKDELEQLPAGSRIAFLALQQRAAAVRSRVADGPRFDAVLAKASSSWAERSTRQVVDDLAKLAPNNTEAFQEGKPLRDLLRKEFPWNPVALGMAERSWGERSSAALVAQLEQLPAGDCDGLLRYRQDGRRLAEQLPEMNARLLEGEKAWGERTAEHTEKRLSKLAVDDWAGLERVRGEHKRIRELLPLLTPRLDAAEWTWAGRVVDDALPPARSLLEKDPLQVSEQLRALANRLDKAGFAPLRPDQPPEGANGAPAMIRKTLVAARLEAARAALTVAQRQARHLIKEDRYQAALAGANTTNERLSKEANALNLGEELTLFHESCVFLARLAREAGKEDPK